jgi:antitoxin HicB
MQYCAKITKEGEMYLVSFPEFESINTYGETIEDALKNAEEALNGALESDFERGYLLPESKVCSGKKYYQIKVYPHLEIAYTLKKLRKNKTQVEIARELGISYQAYQKLENPRKCNPTIKTLEKISNVMGRKLEISFS